MKAAVTLAIAAVALVAGALTGEFLLRMPALHRFLGRICGRGELVAMVHHRGVFEGDVIEQEVLRVSAPNAPVDEQQLTRAMFALRGEFGDERNFAGALRSNGMWKWQLRRMVTDVFRGEEWIENRLAGQTNVSDREARRYFKEHPTDFAQPLRICARHIFLAAPQGSKTVEAKRAAMQQIVVRLNRGEEFAALAAAVSEDDATKSRGGNLGFVAAKRVPAEFWSTLEMLPVNAPAALVESHLGFHAVQVLDVRPPRTMSFEEARPDIDRLLAGRKRREAVQALRDHWRKRLSSPNR